MMKLAMTPLAFGWIGFTWLAGLISFQSIPHTGAIASGL